MRAPIVINIVPPEPNTFDAAKAIGAVEIMSSSAGTKYIVMILTMRYRIIIVITEAIITLGIVFSGSTILSAGTVAVSKPIKLHITNIVTVDNNEKKLRFDGLIAGAIYESVLPNPNNINNIIGAIFKRVVTNWNTPESPTLRIFKIIKLQTIPDAIK